MAKFEKNNRANPGGKPSGLEDLKMLARMKTQKALAVLERLLESDNPTAQLGAAKEILDRGYGKSSQFIEVAKRSPYDELTAQQLIAVADTIARNRLRIGTVLEGESTRLQEAGDIRTVQ